MQMPIITLTSDWGLKDHYLASVKGAFLRSIPDITIIDISHQIPPFDLNQASFILKSAYKNFPEGTIHIVGVNTEASINMPHVLIKHKEHYFIGADNGVFALMFGENPDLIIELDIIQTSNRFSFPTKDVFVQAAMHVIEDNDIKLLGEKRDSLTNKMSFKPVIESNLIKGKVIYIDGYQNVITNITENLFNDVVKGKQFKILLRAGNYKITSISQSYMDVSEGELLAIFDSENHLEIAINKGKASSLLGMSIDDVVRIEVVS
jgi:S-adenosylmethionine hydrolase